jgi:ATP-dependent Clp protease protease subunit
MAASMGAFLLACGQSGKRFSLPNSRVMIHQPSGGFQGTASDIEITANEIIKIRHKLNEILAEKTGQKVAKITSDSDRDFWLAAEEAKAYGIVDEVVKKKPSKSKK